MAMLDTSNPYHYQFKTKELQIGILGGINTNKLDTLRATLAIQKAKQHNIIRQSVDLYNDNTIEKLVRKCAERLEIGTNPVRRAIQDLTRELENYRFLLLEQQQVATPNTKIALTAREEKAPRSR